MAEMVVEKYGVIQFNGKDYDHWKFRMEIVLDNHSVRHCILEEKQNPDETFLSQDKKCKAIIIQCIANSHLQYVKDKNTAHQMWKALEGVFQRKGIASQLYLRKKILTLKLQESDILETHFIKFDGLIRELRSVGAKLEEIDVVCHLLLTLPKSFDGMVTALETLEPKKLSLEFVKGKLLDQEMKMKNQQESEADGSTAVFYSNSKNQFDDYKKYRHGNGHQNHRGGQQQGQHWHAEQTKQYRCHNCGKIGHKRSECRQRKQANQAEVLPESSEESIAFIATGTKAIEQETGDITKWYVDSGATDHMINSIKHFNSVQDLEKPIKVYVAKLNEYVEATKIGNIEILLDVNGCVKKAQIKNVLFVKDLSHNLFSVRKVEKEGFKVVFEQGRVDIYKNDVCLHSGIRVRNLYEIQFKVPINKEYSAYACKPLVYDLDIWHNRLGHLSHDNIKKLENIVKGLNVDKVNVKNDPCKICMESKICRLPFSKKTGRVTKRPLELIHTDVCGPISPETVDGFRYFLTFLDDYTHFTIVYLLKHKSEVYNHFKNYEAKVTAKFQTKIERLCCDNGTEYFSKDFQSFCKAKGIEVCSTIPYTPQLNGAAERLNRTLVEKARAMILQSKLPKDMWGEAILCATYIANRSPTTALPQNVTPAELFYNKKPNLQNLRTFGCIAYYHIPKEKIKGKFDPRGKVCIMIGYTHNGYRLWDTEEKQVVLARDVRFDENKNCQDLIEKKTKISKEDEKETKDESVPNDEIQNAKAQEENIIRERRTRKQPAYLADYETEIDHMILSAQAFVDDVPISYENCKTKDDYKYWKEAIDEEVKSLNKNFTWTLVKKPENAKLIDSKWVFKIKKDSDGEILKYKARLVARGFMQRKGYDYEETYAPVARLSTVRALLAVINFKNLIAEQMDVKSAFLHGILNEDIYMKIPDGVETEDKNLVCKLNKALYGLKQASHCWNSRFNKFATEQNLIQSANDPCLYTKMSNNITYLLLYVDDIILAGNNIQEIVRLKSELTRTFNMQDMGILKQFLGISIRRTNEGMFLNQNAYLKTVLMRFGMDECKSLKTPMENGLKLDSKGEVVKDKPVRQLIGCLMYAALGTRPDINAALNYCSRFQSKPTEALWSALKRILRYVSGTLNLELFFDKNIGIELIGYADADWAGDESDRKSTSGHIFKVFGSTVCWSTRKQSTVAVSSTEAEYVALAEAAKESIWLSNLLDDLGIAKTITVIYEDNQSCIKLTEKWEHKRLKHVDVKFNFVKDLVKDNVIEIKYITTKEQIADILTKTITGQQFIKLRLALGLRSSFIEEGC